MLRIFLKSCLILLTNATSAGCNFVIINFSHDTNINICSLYKPRKNDLPKFHVCKTQYSFIHQWLYSPLLGPGCFFRFVTLHRVGKTPWTGDQPVARPLPTQRIAQHRINEHRHPCLEQDLNPRPQCSRGENSSYVRPRGHCDRHKILYPKNLFRCDVAHEGEVRTVWPCFCTSYRDDKHSCAYVRTIDTNFISFTS
jgi:hypothetical protein